MSLLFGKRFLIVDDDEMLREMIGDIFAGEGAVVTLAKNGVTAFALIESSQFDVVFSDIRMPGGDGIALVTKISQLPGPKPLVFICSGFNDLAPEKAQQLGILKVFEKPFDHNYLIAEISSWLGRSKPA